MICKLDSILTLREALFLEILQISTVLWLCWFGFRLELLYNTTSPMAVKTTLASKDLESNSYCQFHQRFTRAFFVQNFGAKKFQTQNTALKFLAPKGVSFINVLQAAFMRRSRKRKKRQSSCQFFFLLLGSSQAKSARRTLMKLTPHLNSSQYISSL